MSRIIGPLQAINNNVAFVLFEAPCSLIHSRLSKMHINININMAFKLVALLDATLLFYPGLEPAMRVKPLVARLVLYGTKPRLQ